MKIKKFLCLTLTLAILMSIGSFSTQAADTFVMYYSTDNVTWTPVPNFAPETLQYTIQLPANTWYVYLRCDVPTGGSAAYSFRNSENNFSVVGDLKKPEFGLIRIQRLIAKTTAQAAIPIKGGTVDTWIVYKEDETLSDNSEYKLVFNSTQPTITAFTNYISSIGNMSFMKGSQVNNDNRTLIDSNASTSDNRAWALANVSENLLGTSELLLPIATLDSTACSAETYPVLATFTTDTPCTVYVMRPNAVSTTEYENWTTLNDGNQGVATNSTYTTPRSYNSYTNTDYYGIAYKWVCNTGGSASAPYMLTDPGVDGELSSTHIKGTSHLNYVYAKSFDVGENISIGNPGELGGSDQDAIMTVLIKWHLPEPTVTVTELSASSTTDATTITATNTVVKSSPNQTCDYEAIAAIYNDSTCNELIDVAVGRFTEGETTLTFNKSDYGDDAYVQFFVWKLGDLKPYTKKTVGLLSDISD